MCSQGLWHNCRCMDTHHSHCIAPHHMWCFNDWHMSTLMIVAMHPENIQCINGYLPVDAGHTELQGLRCKGCAIFHCNSDDELLRALQSEIFRLRRFRYFVTHFRIPMHLMN